MAPQLIWMNGPPVRSDCPWSARATSSLPVPDSPVINTEAVVGAVAGYLILWSVYQLFRLLTGKEGMGYGDFKLLAQILYCVGDAYQLH